MINDISEQIQRMRFVDLEKQNGISYFIEVPVFTRSVDLVKFDQEQNSITAIEFKLFKWKKAIEQVLQLSICFDFLEICINEPKLTKTKEMIVSTCLDFGIGVYFFNEFENSFNHILKPLRKENVWKVQREKVLMYIGENE